MPKFGMQRVAAGQPAPALGVVVVAQKSLLMMVRMVMRAAVRQRRM
jgi:hypothetical protein